MEFEENDENEVEDHSSVLCVSPSKIGLGLQQIKPISEPKIRRHLPVGKGPYTVGCVDFMDKHSTDGVFFRLYYPTKTVDIYKRDKQWQLWLPRKQYGEGYVYFLNKNKNTFGKFLNWYFGDVYIPALWRAPVLRLSQHKHPVIIMSHGVGGNRTCYSTLCCELASNGFVVAALEHRDGSASMALCLKECVRNSLMYGSTEEVPHPPKHLNLFHEVWMKFEKVKDIYNFEYRNKQVYHRATECSYVLDVLTAMNKGEHRHNLFGPVFDSAQLKNCLDLSKVSVIGHSFGGATCLCTLAQDKRFKTGVVLDGWMHPLDDHVYKNVNQPCLMINYETFQWSKNIQQMQEFLTERHPHNKMVTVMGTCHQSITDFQFIANAVFGRIMGVRYTLPPTTAFTLSAKGVMGYLRKHLGLPGDHHDDIINGEHVHVISGTNVTL